MRVLAISQGGKFRSPHNMPEVFEKLGLRFQYPDNWTAETDTAQRGQRSVSVYSPEGAFWTVVLQPAGGDPLELAKVTLATMRQEYEDLDSEPVREKVGQIELIGFDVNFYCLDLTNTAWIRAGNTAAATYLILCQAEDQEFSEVADIFRAMTASLLM
jgi:hypothetical protein